MKNFTKVMLLALLSLGLSVTAQNGGQGPTYVGTPATKTYVSPIASRMAELAPATVKGEAKDGRYRSPKREVVPGKGTQEDVISQNPHRMQGAVPGRMPDLVFDAAVSNSQPTDPALAIGPDHVFVVFNTGFAIYDKDGNTLVAPSSPVPAIFPTNACCDLTVSYDPIATSASNSDPGRWVLSFLGGGAQIAVSDGPDPVTAGWNVYNIPTVNDYNKLSVWSDGYYLTDQAAGNRLYAMERQAMLDGEPAANVSIQGFPLPNIGTFGFASPQVLNISDDNYPDAGNATVVFFQDDAYAGITTDHIKFWDVDVDFDTPANSTVSTPQEVDVTPFTSIFDGGAFPNLTQPGGQDIDALQGIIMNQAQYRKFPSHNSAIFNFTIDAGTGGNELAAIRWYEFRQTDDGEPWTLFQEGTYTSPEGKHAWNASMTIDNLGNIGMGYTGMGNTATGSDVDQFVSSYYTGRFSSDAPGVMSISEQTIALGGGNIPGFERYGDYSKIDIDPTDYQTMWFINEYISPVNGRANVVGRFKIAPDFDNDIGVIAIDAPVDGDLSAPQDVTVTVFNFGLNDASGFDVTYQIDGGAVVTEAFPGTLASASSAQYTFTAQGDFSVVGQTYSVTASTANFAADEFADNDATTVEVTHLQPIDVGVSAVISPVTGNSLSSAEDVTIQISNFGSMTQTSIPVFYTLNDGAPIMETYSGSIAQGATDTYTFAVQADLSEIGEYVIVVGTELTADADMANDDIEVTVENSICAPVSDCAGFDDGVTLFALADQDLVTECGATGYADNSDIIFNFVLGDNPFDGTLQMGFIDSIYALWIDFNDNNIFEADEVISSEQVAQADTDFDFTVNFADFPNVTQGMHRMRLRGEDESTAGDVLDPCDDLQFGRTNDYTANITGALSLEDGAFGAADLQIIYLQNDQYEVIFENGTNQQPNLPITVYNTLGQKLAYYTVDNNGNGFRKTIDMSNVSAGVYFVQVGDDTLNKVKRIVVR